MATKNVFEGVKAPLHMVSHLMTGFEAQAYEELLAEKGKELAALLLESDPTALYVWLGSKETFSEHLDRNGVVQRFLDKGWIHNGMKPSPRGIGYFFPERYTELVKG